MGMITKRFNKWFDNFNKRLALKYNGQYQLDIQDKEDQFFVHFKIHLAYGNY